MKELTPRELATVLAALRYWQDFVVHGNPGWSKARKRYQKRARPASEEAPLDSDEIDALCEELNIVDQEEEGAHV